MANNNFPSERVIVEHVRLSYAQQLITPKAFEGPGNQVAKYGVTLLIPKGSPAAAKLQAAFDRIKEQSKDSVFGGRLGGVSQTLRDGDTDERQPVEEHPEHAGHLFISVSSTTKPGIVDANRQPVFDAEQIYSGRWANVSVNVRPFKTQTNKGITAYLGNVQLLEAGESLGGSGPKAEDEFGEVELPAADQALI